MKPIVWVNLAIVVIACLVFVAYRDHAKREGFAITDYKTRCFSCESSLPPELAWMGQPTKSFDAERELIAMSGGDVSMGAEAHPLKFYTEGHPSLGPMTFAT